MGLYQADAEESAAGDRLLLQDGAWRLLPLSVQGTLLDDKRGQEELVLEDPKNALMEVTRLKTTAT